MIAPAKLPPIDFIGQAIILPTVRYAPKKDRPSGHLYHVNCCDPELFPYGDCNNLNNQGLCDGHEITRKKFIKLYCGGIRERVPV